MKHLNLFLLTMLLCLGVQQAVQAQSESKAVIKILKEVDGKKIKIDTTLEGASQADIDQMLKDLGIDEDIAGKDVNVDKTIIIKKGDDIDISIDKDNLDIDVEQLLKSIGSGEDMEQEIIEEEYTTEDGKKVKKKIIIKKDKYDKGAMWNGNVEDFLSEHIGENLGEDAHIFHFFNDGGDLFQSGSSDANVFFLRDGDRPFLGVTMVTDDEEEAASEKGVEVNEVIKDSAAEAAGLESGDVIIAVNSKAVDTPKELADLIGQFEVGEEVTILYERNGKRANTTATLKKRKEVQNWSNLPNMSWPTEFGKAQVRLGVYTSAIFEEGGHGGVLISGIAHDSPAGKAGLKKGDIILKIDQDEMNSGDALRENISQREEGDKVMVTYKRKGEVNTVEVELESTSNVFPFHSNRSKCDDRPAFDWNEGEFRLATPGKARLGVMVESFTNDKDQKGVKITGLDGESAAAKAGLKEGDLIRAIDGKEINNYMELIQAINDYDVGDKVEVLYDRDKQSFRTEVILEATQLQRLKMEGLEGLEEIEEKLKDFRLERDREGTPRWNRTKKVKITDASEAEEEIMGKRGAKTDIEELMFENVSFYPNPNNGKFNLAFGVKQPLETTVRLLDISGKEIFEEKLGEFEGTYNKQLDVSDKTQNGVYLLQIQRGDGVLNKKVVVQ